MAKEINQVELREIVKPYNYLLDSASFSTPSTHCQISSSHLPYSLCALEQACSPESSDALDTKPLHFLLCWIHDHLSCQEGGSRGGHTLSQILSFMLTFHVQQCWGEESLVNTVESVQSCPELLPLDTHSQVVVLSVSNFTRVCDAVYSYSKEDFKPTSHHAKRLAKSGQEKKT